MKNNIKLEGLLPLLLIFTSIISQTQRLDAQRHSKWQLRIGYEHVYIRSGLTNGLAEKEWIWTDPTKGDLLAARTSLTHGLVMGVSYKVTPWWSITWESRQYWRRYYIWSGTYFGESRGGDHTFKIAPRTNFLFFPSMFLGATLRTKSLQLGTEFSHRLDKHKKWRLHYILSLNRDQYEINLNRFDTSIDYGSGKWYNDKEGIRREGRIEGDLHFRAFNPGDGGYQGSTNIGIALSRNFNNGAAIRWDLGYRNILWTENLQLRENHFELDLTYTEWIDDEVVYESAAYHELPLEIGGIYSSVSFTCRPFRSRFDDPEFEKRKFNVLFWKKSKKKNQKPR